MNSLFDLLPDPYDDQWKPEEPPLLCSAGIKRICLDTETTGLHWWEQHRPIGLSVFAKGGLRRYVPWGHRGGNLDEATVKRWAQRELRDLHITNINTKFDVHQLRAWGVDLEAQNVTVSDVSHYAALLDDHRQKFSLEVLAQERFGRGKIEGLDKTRMASYHAGQVAEYAMNDVELVSMLEEAQLPEIKAQSLERVLDVENRLIYPLCSMEALGSPINHALLQRWLKQTSTDIGVAMMALTKLADFQCHPNKPDHLHRLFSKFGLPIERTALGRPSFTDAITKRHAAHPAIALVRKIKKLESLRSKYLVKYQKGCDSHGIFRYALHQLRTQKDEWATEGESGTISGRFSSSEIADGVGGNIQQVMKAAKQRVEFGYDEDDDSHDEEIYVIRRLHVPPSGRLWLTSDARQIEYRYFAHVANNPRVIAAYKQDPLLNFHKFMHNELKQFNANLTYRRQKDLNFAVIYGAGMVKRALMMGFISNAEYLDIRNHKRWDDMRLDVVKEVSAIYNREMPETEQVLSKAMFLAKPHCDKDCQPRHPEKAKRQRELHAQFQHQGFVETLLGRRSRFPDGHRLHKAFNGEDQGSCADIMKLKIIDLYARRQETGFVMRYPVHDEVDGDIGEVAGARLVGQILDEQSFPELRVPILWEVEVGKNWAQTSSYLESQFAGAERTRAEQGITNCHVVGPHGALGE